MMAKSKIVVPDKLAIMAFDPGGTTGVGWATMDVKGTLAETLQGAEIASCDITGTYQQQASKLVDLWNTMYYGWTIERGIPADCVELVSEGFTLRKFGSSDKKGLYPVWISAMVEGALWKTGVRVVYQDPSTKGRTTTARMKRWGIWERGASQHRKDTMKHIAYRVNQLI